MSFKISNDGMGISFIEDNLIQFRKFVLCVQQQRTLIDFCAFNENRKYFAYDTLKQQDKMKKSKEDITNWGSTVFSWNAIKVNNKRKCFHRSNGSNHENDHKNTLEIQSETYVRLHLDARMCEAVIRQCKESETFLQNFMRYTQAHYPKKIRKTNSKDDIHGKLNENRNSTHISIPLIIFINLLDSEKENIQLKWDERIHRLVAKKGYMEDAMSWLNTLGGGYSALGDYFTHHAKEAGRVSMRQLKVALEMGDPPTVIRCYLYFGLSLMQCGHLRRAKYIIRHQYQLAQNIAATDHRLRSSCLGLWSRLGYLYHQRSAARQQCLH